MKCRNEFKLVLLLAAISCVFILLSTLLDLSFSRRKIVYQSVDISQFYPIHYNTSKLNITDLNYIQTMIKWSVSPNSFCFENFHYYHNPDLDSSYVLLSITNLNELNRNLTVTKKFIFYLRISRILYANKYKYKYCEFAETFDISKPPHWSKWNSIRMISSLNNVKHIVWIDLDAIFHSKTPALQNSSFNYNETKLFVFTKSTSNKGINAGIFMANSAINISDGTNKTWNVIDVLDFFSWIERDRNIKTFTPPYEQLVLRVFRKEYTNKFNALCAMLDDKYKMQLFGKNKKLQLNYNFFIWHWTGVDERYQKMIPVMRKEIHAFLEQMKFNTLIFQSAMNDAVEKYKLNDIIHTTKKHLYEPEWIKTSLICESTWWTKDKAKRILGKVYNATHIKALCWS